MSTWEKEQEHVRIAKKMNQLDKLSVLVSFGFIAYWLLLALATGFWIFAYVWPSLQGWFS